MSPRPNRRTWPLMLCSGLLAVSSLGAAAQAPYQFSALHEPGIALGLNGRGAAVGSTNPMHDGHPHATLWRRNLPLDLNQSDEESIAYGINRYLAVAGVSRKISGGDWQATLWTDGTPTLLPTLGGTFSGAHSINNGGQIAGESALAGDSEFHAVRWEGNGLPVDLGTLGGQSSTAYAVNAFGDAVGYSYTIGNKARHATLWPFDGSAAVDLGTLGWSDSVATAVNRKRWVAGYSDVGDFQKHATMWRDGVAIDLGTLAEGRTSYGWGIDQQGTVVGYSYTTADNKVKYRRAAMWRDGTAIDLNTLLDDATRAAGWVLLEAHAINDDGVIAGLAKNSLTGKERAYRLTPP